MVESEDVLFRPVLRGFYSADKLLDGSIDLAFVMLCNEALDVESENDARLNAHERAKQQQPRRS
jgi:hypothetical protein